MATRGGRTGPSRAGDLLLLAELVRLRWLGYVRYRDLLVAGFVSFVALTALIAVLPLNAYLVGVLGTMTVVALVLSLFGSALTHRQQVNVYTANGLYIAEHQDAGRIRHGETPEEALTNLAVVLESRFDET